LPNFYAKNDIYGKKFNYVFYDNPNMFVTENKLKPFLDLSSLTNIFKLKNIIIINTVSDELISNGRLSKYIFVEQRYLDKFGEKWIDNLSLSYTNALLIPYNTDFEIEIFDISKWKLTFGTNSIITLIIDDIKIDKNLHLFENSSSFSLLKILKSSWIRRMQNIDLYEYCGPIKYDSSNIVEMIIFYKILSSGIDNIDEFIIYFNTKVSEFKPQFAYGSYKYKNFPQFSILPFASILNVKNIENNKNLIPGTIQLYNDFNKIIQKVNNSLSFYYIDNFLNSQDFIQFKCMIYPFININGASKNLTEEFIEGLSLCYTNEEYFIFLLIMTKFITLPNYQYVKGMASFLVSSIREKSNLTVIIREFLSVEPSSSENFDNYILSPLTLYLKNYVKSKLIQNISISLETDYQYQFTAKDLIYFIYSYDESSIKISNMSSREIFSLVNKIVRPQGNNKLQIVEIAVNNGTIRSFPVGVLTELIQNSVDAIRKIKSNQGGRVNNKINISISKNNISIRDYIGFNNFLPLMIPFLSSKDVNDPSVTGEMGTGFFNIYRYPFCKEIIISSSFNGTLIIISAKPIIENERIIDISYSISEEANDNSFTNISVYLNDYLLTETITESYIYANNFAGIIPDVLISLNSEIIMKNQTNVISNDIGSISFVDNKDQISFTLTNGIPFMEFKDFISQFDGIPKILINICISRVILNFNKNIYTPSQTRTKINIPDHLKRIIIEFIKDGLFITCLNFYIEDNATSGLNKLISHSLSTSNINQLKLSTIHESDESNIKNLDNYIIKPELLNYLNFTDFNGIIGVVTFSKIINNTIDKIKKNNLSIDDLSQNNLINQVVYKWFKNKEFRLEYSNIRQTIVFVKNNYNLLQLFINEYWRMLKLAILSGKIIGINLIGIPPTIYEERLLSGILGIYKKIDHSLSLNIEDYPQSNFNESINRIKGSSNISIALNIDSYLQKFFAVNFPTTLIHEIGHSIQNQSHMDTASHGRTGVRINGSDELEFDDMCLGIFILLSSEGLMINFLSMI